MYILLFYFTFVDSWLITVTLFLPCVLSPSRSASVKSHITRSVAIFSNSSSRAEAKALARTEEVHARSIFVKRETDLMVEKPS